MNKIKNVSLVFLMMVALIGYQSNAQTRRADKILKDSEQRAYIMKTIINDSLMMVEMTRYITENEKAMEHLNTNRQFIKQLMSSKGMMHKHRDTTMAKMMMKSLIERMEKDSIVCKMMGKMLMEKKHLKCVMQDTESKKEGMKMCPMCKEMKKKTEEKN